MKKTKNIHNLDTLEREIYRLKSEAKDIEEKLDRNLDHFQENYWSMTMNSFFCKDENKTNGEHSFGKNLFKHEGFNAVVNTIAENIADKATEGLHSWMNNLFGRNKH
jgi:hypothetical protein